MIDKVIFLFKLLIFSCRSGNMFCLFSFWNPVCLSNTFFLVSENLIFPISCFIFCRKIHEKLLGRALALRQAISHDPLLASVWWSHSHIAFNALTWKYSKICCFHDWQNVIVFFPEIPGRNSDNNSIDKEGSYATITIA